MLTRPLRLLLLTIVAVWIAMPSAAVLKEKNIGNTLVVLRGELTEVHLEQERHTLEFKEQSDKIRENLYNILRRSDQNALMLYSQRLEYVFDLTYACHEATDQYKDFQQNALPFHTYMASLNAEITRYDSLITSLRTMSSQSLDAQELTDRDVCLALAVNIRKTMEADRETLSEYISMYDEAELHLKELNDYANERYIDIQNNIFSDGGDSYFTILSSFGDYLSSAFTTVSDKYKPSTTAHSQWDSRMMIGLFMVIIIYGLLSIIINIVAAKFLMPSSMRGKDMSSRRMCVVFATSVVTFAILVGIVRVTVEQNFLLMASNLLVEYAWLLGVILISLLLRLGDSQLGNALRIYAPLMIVGFLVITFRITLIPSDVVNIVFPPVLLLSSVWQWIVTQRRQANIPNSDTLYAYITLVVFAVSTVSSWIGSTLLSVQILIWWIMQLTCILTITCLVSWMKKYSDSHHIYEKPVTHTWIFRFIYRVAMPVMGLFSIVLSIYWAADVFNLSDMTWSIFTRKFVDTDNISISIFTILIVISLYFLFGYINRVSLDLLKQHSAMYKGDVKTVASRSIMGKNIVQALVWCVWIVLSLSIMNVSTTWLVVISGGLSTGVGFASKDILENIYYGISLMTGRIKIGDWVECDGIKGKVSSISYTSTLIESVDGSIIAFQNSQLFTKNYKNLTRNHGYVLATVPFGVAYGSNAKQVCDMVEQAVRALNHKYIDSTRTMKVVFTELGDSSLNFKLLCWVDVVKYTFVVSDLVECIYNTLNAHNVEIPFPQQDVHIKDIAH